MIQKRKKLKTLSLKSCAGKRHLIIKEVGTIKDKFLTPHWNNRKGC